MIDESQNFRRFSLTAHMHGNGINMRHLGRVRSHVTDRGGGRSKKYYEDPELLRQLFVSYVVSREKLFSKRKIISGLVDGAFNEAATKDSIFKALHVTALFAFSYSPFAKS